MAENSGGGGAGLGIVVGGLVVAVAVIGFLVANGGAFNSSKNINVNIKPPSVSAPATGGGGQ